MPLASIRSTRADGSEVELFMMSRAKSLEDLALFFQQYMNTLDGVLAKAG